MWKYKPKKPYGVIVATDQELEWMLPWWWLHYRLHNSYPVTFVDLGMSERGRNFCKKRGQLEIVDLSSDFVFLQDRVAKDLAASWSTVYGAGFWYARNAWFKKPFALLKTPYKRTLWLDLDCEVCGSLESLLEKTERLALVPENPLFQQMNLEYGLRLKEELAYSSGVVVYDHGLPIIEDWAKKSMEDNKSFIGDQNVLSRLIYEKKENVFCLPETCNWHMKLGENPNALIKHWAGGDGKIKIHEQMQVIGQLVGLEL